MPDWAAAKKKPTENKYRRPAAGFDRRPTCLDEKKTSCSRNHLPFRCFNPWNCQCLAGGRSGSPAGIDGDVSHGGKPPNPARTRPDLGGDLAGAGHRPLAAPAVCPPDYPGRSFPVYYGPIMADLGFDAGRRPRRLAADGRVGDGCDRLLRLGLAPQLKTHDPSSLTETCAPTNLEE